MNEQDELTAPAEATPPYKDRSTGLIFYGIITILFGCLVALFIPLMLFARHLQISKGGEAVSPPSALTMAMGMYGMLAVALVWLGIGSIMARRWARALLLIYSWVWLLIGFAAMAVMGFVIAKMPASSLAGSATGHPAHPGVPTGAMIFAMLITGVFFLVFPAIWILFYKNPDVKATCEARDPVIRWTDRCPLPVLAVSLWAGYSAAMMLITPITNHFVMPLFGIFITGIAGVAIYPVIAAVWIYAAWSLYKLELRGWWLTFIVMCLFTASSIVTFAGHHQTEMYQRMGYSQAQMDRLQNSGFMTGNYVQWLTLLCTVPILGYLLYIKRYFRRAS